MNVDLKYVLTLSIVLAMLGFLSSAGSQFTDLGLSPVNVKQVLALFGILLGCGNAVNSVLIAFGMTKSGRLASVEQVPLVDRAANIAADPGVNVVVLKSQAAADSVTTNKVIGPKDVGEPNHL